MPTRLTAIAALMVLAIILWGCSTTDNNGDSPNNSSVALDAATVMGLSDNHALIYLQTDTLTDSNLTLEVEVTHRTLRIGGSGTDWVVYDGDTPMANLKVNDESITLNGYWHQRTGQDNLSYFAVPPVLMARYLTPDEPWAGFTPFINLGNGNQSYPFAFAHFGFFFEKTYVGRELIQLPAGSFHAYRFDVELFHNFHDTVPEGTVREYYYPSVGLVQLNFHGGPMNRTLSLISWE